MQCGPFLWRNTSLPAVFESRKLSQDNLFLQHTLLGGGGEGGREGEGKEGGGGEGGREDIN